MLQFLIRCWELFWHQR